MKIVTKENEKYEDGFNLVEYNTRLAAMNTKQRAKFMDEHPLYENGKEFISTWVISLDALMWGWYALGRVVEISGSNNVGKTTLVLRWILEAQALGMKCFFIDAENAMSRDRMTRIGIDDSKVELMVSHVIEAIFEEIEKKLKDGYKFIVLDSVWVTMPSFDVATKPWEERMMGRSKVNSSVMKQIVPQLQKYNAVLILINQTYSSAEMYWPTKISKWGGQIGYSASQRLEVVGDNTASKQVSVVDGKEIKAWENDAAWQKLKIRLMKTKVLNCINAWVVNLTMKYSDGQIAQFEWFIQMLSAWDILREGRPDFNDEAGNPQKSSIYYLNPYSDMPVTIWGATKIRKYVIDNIEELKDELLKRCRSRTYERQCSKDFNEDFF